MHTYAPGTPERALIRAELDRQSASAAQHLPHVIGGREHAGTGRLIDVVQPHAHREVLGTIRAATHDDARAAVDAALAAAPATAPPLVAVVRVSDI